MYWHPEDKQWMKERKELWKTIKYNLDLLSKSTPIKRSYHKYHKELFFYGSINEEVWGEWDFDIDPTDVPVHELSGLDAFWSMLPVFRIWYHPNPEVLDLDKLREEFRRCGSLESARERYFREFDGAGAGGGFGYAYYPEYGMMGGREELVVRFLCPGLDYMQELPGVRRPEFTSKPCFIPLDTYWNCRGSTTIELYQDARFSPYTPGRYLWDHLSYALEHYQERIYSHGGSEDLKEGLLIVMAEILDFDARTDTSRNRPSTIDMVERLTTKYDRKDFSDVMLSLWDQAKADIVNLRKKGRGMELFKWDEKELETAFGRNTFFPVEEQRKWIARWKQV